jgi:hypothetical protein
VRTLTGSNILAPLPPLGFVKNLDNYTKTSFSTQQTMATATAADEKSITTRSRVENAPPSVSPRLSTRLWLATRHYYDTGFTYFGMNIPQLSPHLMLYLALFPLTGGPPVHFQLLYKRFVQDHHWVDEKTVSDQISQYPK